MNMTRAELRDAIAAVLRIGGQVSFPEKWHISAWYRNVLAAPVEEPAGRMFHIDGTQFHSRVKDPTAAAEILISAVFKPENLALCINGILKRKPLPPGVDPDDVAEDEWLKQIRAYQKEFFYTDYPWASPAKETT